VGADHLGQGGVGDRLAPLVVALYGALRPASGRGGLGGETLARVANLVRRCEPPALAFVAVLRRRRMQFQVYRLAPGRILDSLGRRKLGAWLLELQSARPVDLTTVSSNTAPYGSIRNRPAKDHLPLVGLLCLSATR
jgi:hypothetical protein